MRIKLPPLPEVFDLEVLVDKDHELRPLYLEFTYAYNKVCFAKFYLSVNQQFRIETDYLEDLCSDVYTDLVTNIYKYLYNEEKKKGKTTLNIRFLKKHIYRRSWARLKELISFDGMKKPKQIYNDIFYTTTVYSRLNREHTSYNVLLGEEQNQEWVSLIPSDSFTPDQEAAATLDKNLNKIVKEDSKYSWERYKSKRRLNAKQKGRKSSKIQVTLVGNFNDGKNKLYFRSIHEAATVLNSSSHHLKILLLSGKSLNPHTNKKDYKVGAKNEKGRYITPKTFIYKIERL